MPHGKLYIRSNRTNREWVDAFDTYGLSFEPGSLFKLMTPAPGKDGNSIKPVGTHGVAYSGSTIGFKDERIFSMDMHIVASSEADYLTKYAAFCANVIDCGYFQLKTSTEPGKVYHLIYKDCQPSKQFLSGMAIFTLTVKEPHPEIHDDRITGFTSTNR